MEGDKREDLEKTLKDFPITFDAEGPRPGGVIVKNSDCCGVSVTQSRGAHDMGNGMYVGGVIFDYCPKCHKPYHPPIIGRVQ
ncbi:MAG TPA: hypothetical protein VJH92_06340 [Candidatus Nanoarchaeia archaeon]|nr:hypothetical protein [Candidatus Nanoarchaeia archaeon]